MSVIKSVACVALCLVTSSPSSAHMLEVGNASEGDRNAPIAEALTELARHQADDARIARNLETFRELDLEIFSNNEIERFDESHTDDVIVYYPDGRVTQGLDVHIEDVRWFFAWAPDTHVERHIVRFGQGEWSAAIGILKGTFTEPMPTPEGDVIEPTGNSYEITFTTIARWNDEGKMYEEYLFWDNRYFFEQLLAE